MARSNIPVKSALTVLEIIEATMKLDSATPTQLAKETGYSKSTIHNHLMTLSEQGYVTKSDSEYDLSYEFLVLGEYTRNRHPLYEAAKPEIEELAEEIGEVVKLETYEGHESVHLYKSENQVDINFKTRPGLHNPLHCTAVGKAMMAHFPEEVIDQIIKESELPSMTENTTTDPDKLKEELTMIRDRGVAFDDEEIVEGLRCVAVPLHSNNEVTAAISISGPKRRLAGERFKEQLPEKLLHRANIIELNSKQPQ